MILTLIWYPKCTTCQKAKKFLESQGFTPTLRDIKTQPPTQAELRLWHTASGLPLKRFFNTSGLVYKELALKDRLPTMTQSAQYALLATNGMLVKRPILLAGGGVCVGFQAEQWSDALGRAK